MFAWLMRVARMAHALVMLYLRFTWLYLRYTCAAEKQKAPSSLFERGPARSPLLGRPSKCVSHNKRVTHTEGSGVPSGQIQPPRPSKSFDPPPWPRQPWRATFQPMSLPAYPWTASGRSSSDGGRGLRGAFRGRGDVTAPPAAESRKPDPPKIHRASSRARAVIREMDVGWRTRRARSSARLRRSRRSAGGLGDPVHAEQQQRAPSGLFPATTRTPPARASTGRSSNSSCRPFSGRTGRRSGRRTGQERDRATSDRLDPAKPKRRTESSK